MESTSSPSLPPQCLLPDEYTAADAARQRFINKSRFPLFRSAPNLRRAASKGKVKGGNPKSRRKRKDTGDQDEHSFVSVDDDSHLSSEDLQPLEEGINLSDKIILDDSAIPDSLEDKDVYRWAMLYENQRGYVL